MADEQTTADEATAAPAAEQPDAAAAPGPAAPAEPVEMLHPKERRRRERSAHAGDSRPAQSPQERQAAREALRAEKARARRTGRVKQREKAKQRAAAAGPQTEAIVHEHGPGRPKMRQGIVVSDKGQKTITVRIDTSRRHRRYKKIVRSSATLHVHDERSEAGEGDLVRVVETRPMSRTKRWRLTEILERAR